MPKQPSKCWEGGKDSSSSSVSVSAPLLMHRSEKTVDPCLLLWRRFSAKALTKGLGSQSPFHHQGLTEKSNVLPEFHLCEDIFLREPPLRSQVQTLPPPEPSLLQVLRWKAHLNLDPLTNPAKFPTCLKMQ